MAYKFQEASSEEFSQKELTKFLALGWWLYSQIPQNESPKDPSLDIEGVD